MNICLRCGKKLRPCKRIDFKDREYHLSCIEKMKKEKYEQELKDFVSLMSEKMKNIDLP